MRTPEFHRGRLTGVALFAVLAVMAGCAAKLVNTPVVTTPRFPDFVQPTVPPDLAASLAATSQERAWLFLQAGDFRNADHEIAAALKSTPDFYPAEAVAGYLQLAQKDARSAMTRFERALARRPDYAPALAGKGQALEALSRDGEAIEAFQAAVAADRSLVDVQRRIEVLRFRDVQRDVAAARQAARSGRVDEAIRAYRAAIEHSPDTAFLYRELAGMERERGDADLALADFRKAASLDPTDAASIAQTAELLEARGDVDAALQAYADALAIEPDARVDARRNALRARAEAARMPAEYRAIEAATEITRADLAALVGVRLGSLLDVTRARDVGVITDIRGNWAETWILAVTRAGVLDPFANHTFQPRTVVRRVDFAQAITRLLDKVAVVAPAQAATWANARGQFSDITPGHLAYPAASTATAAGVMTTAPDRSFEPSRPVTGAEAIGALEILRAMASLPGPDRERR